MHVYELVELKEQLAAWLVAGRGEMHLTRHADGKLKPTKKASTARRTERFGRTELQRFDIWDGERVLCSAGSHATGQYGVRVTTLINWVNTLPLDTFNPKTDTLGILRNGDTKTVIHCRYGWRR